jgi:hypothetical protein
MKRTEDPSFPFKVRVQRLLRSCIDSNILDLDKKSFIDNVEVQSEVTLRIG